jgi:hypothetical protein
LLLPPLLSIEGAATARSCSDAIEKKGGDEDVWLVSLLKEGEVKNPALSRLLLSLESSLGICSA